MTIVNMLAHGTGRGRFPPACDVSFGLPYAMLASGRDLTPTNDTDGGKARISPLVPKTLIAPLRSKMMPPLPHPWQWRIGWRRREGHRRFPLHPDGAREPGGPGDRYGTEEEAPEGDEHCGKRQRRRRRYQEHCNERHERGSAASDILRLRLISDPATRVPTKLANPKPSSRAETMPMPAPISASR